MIIIIPIILNNQPPLLNPAGKNKKPATIFNLMKVNRVAQNPNFFSSGRSVNISLF